jgi:hypothetical protein
MKRQLLVAIMLCVAAGYASAQEETLAPIIVEHINGTRIFVDCAPPNDAPACADFHALIRENFSPREIGMLFGPSTAYIEYRAGYDQTRDRYVAFLRDIEENGMPVEVSSRY